MHKTVLKLIKDEEEKIQHLEQRNYDCSDEIEESQIRASELKRLWLKYRNKEYVKKMTKLVDKKVESFHVDFFYWDLALIDKFGGRIAWFVGENGTHLVFLDSEDEVTDDRQKSKLKAVLHHYGNYDSYEINTDIGTIHKVDPKKIEFKIVKPIG